MTQRSGFCKQCQLYYAIDTRFDEAKHVAQCPTCKSLLKLTPIDRFWTTSRALAGFIKYSGGHK